MSHDSRRVRAGVGLSSPSARVAQSRSGLSSVAPFVPMSHGPECT